MSVISTEIKNLIIEEMEEELDERDYYYSRNSLEKIVNVWSERKSNLIDLLSKHPSWNPEKLMIQFDTDVERRICTNEIYSFVNWLQPKVNGEWTYWESYENQSKEYKICNFISSINSQFFDDSMEDKINEMNSLNDNFKLRANMKSSKAIGKICREEGWDKLDGFNQQYAKLCDCLSPLKIRRHTCISLNPIDFLLMSNGNSWESCHYIGTAGDSGCYSSGTVSYMLDERSFIFYTVDASYDGNQIERQPKIQRQVFGYNDETIVQLRLYPQSNDSGAKEVYDSIRAIVQKVIADCLDKPNLWVKSKYAESISRLGSGATCYPDWRRSNPGGDLCTTSVHKERENKDDLPEFIFGAQPICIDCGREHSYDESISCCESDVHYCTHCGARIYGDDIYWVEGRWEEHPYCEDCVTYCDECNEYRPNEEVQEIDGRYVCDHCIDYSDNYYVCDACGEVHHIDYMVWTENEDKYCEDCAETETFTCETCRCIYSMSASYYDEETEAHYCYDCYDELLEERTESEQEDEEVAI